MQVFAKPAKDENTERRGREAGTENDVGEDNTYVAQRQKHAWKVPFDDRRSCSLATRHGEAMLQTRGQRTAAVYRGFHERGERNGLQ